MNGQYASIGNYQKKSLKNVKIHLFSFFMKKERVYVWFTGNILSQVYGSSKEKNTV